MRRRLATILIFVLLQLILKTDAAPCDIEGGRYELILDVTESDGEAFDQPVTPTILPVEGDPGTHIDLQLSEEGRKRFSLREKTLSLVGPLDRDRERLSTLRFEVSCTVKSSTQTRSIPVVVRIHDINDNTPQFRGAPYHVAIKEDTKVGFPIFSGIEASDLDSGRNGQVEYEILGISPSTDDLKFSIRFPHQGVVFLMSPLDYETTPLYEVIVMAKDYSSDPGERLNSTTTLTIRVQDVDDLDPVFDTANRNCSRPAGEGRTAAPDCLPQYQASVIEGNIAGVLDIYPGRIHAKDMDTLGASITYSFMSGTPTSFDDYFKIDPRTGVVTQVKIVDRAKIKNFDIVLMAKESTTRRGRAAARLLVNVKKVDTSPPKLVIPAYTGKVQEASAPGTPVLRDDGSDEPFVLAVFDPDVDPGEPPPRYIFELTTNSFKVNEEGVLVVAVPSLDRDPPNLARHMFQAIAREDRDGGSASAPVTLTVSLLDINDNPPRLPIIPTVTFPAGSDRRDVIRVRAKDADEGENAVPKYKLASGGREKFAIDPDTGMITAVGNLVAGEDFFLNIEVRDIGNLSTEGFVEVVVSRGPNTDGPIFSRNRYSVIVPEDIPHGEQILTVQAKDPEDDNSYYSITGGNVGKSFEVDTLSGLITVVAPLDREKHSEHSLIIKAEDSEGKSNTATVLIQVTDVNDEAPEFIGEPYSFRVDEGVKNSLVGQVEAKDKDLGVFGKVLYLLEGTSPMFKVDSSSGEIFTNVSLDYEKDQVHYVGVVAHDMAEDPRSSTTTVTVLVNDVSDEDPTFPRHSYITHVAEGTAVGSVVATVEAVDKDTIPAITYWMVEGDSALFKVASDSGRVTLAGDLDYEAATNHTIIIGTEQNAARTPGAITKVVVEVEDLNDEGPTLEEIHTVTLPRGASPGTLLTNVSARDGDGSAPNNQITFAVDDETGLVSPYFEINGATGAIRLSKKLDHQFNATEFSLKVTATDGGDPPLSSSGDVRVLILQGVKESFDASSVSGVSSSSSSSSGFNGKSSSVAASSPRFSNNEFELQVNENIPVGSVVAKVPLTNTSTSSVTCSIINGDEEEAFKARITLDGNCKIVSSKVLDFEMKSVFNLTLVLYPEGFALANGQNLPPVLSQASVFIMVKDVNDNSPKFKLSGFDMVQGLQHTTVLAFVLQDSPVDTMVLQVQAIDSDSGGWGSISYSLQPESNRGNYFSVDGRTGRVFLKRSLADVPLELLPFNLSLVARDEPGQNGAAHSSLLNIIVPVIEESHQALLVLEDSKDVAKKEAGNLQDILSQASGKRVQIEAVSQERKSAQKGSIVWFHLLDTGTFMPISPQMIYEEEESIFGTLEKSGIGVTPQKLISPKHLSQSLSAKDKESILTASESSPEGSVGVTRLLNASLGDLTTLEYALIALAAVIILFVLCAICVVCVLWSKFSKKWNSADKTVMLIPPVLERPASVLESVSKEYEVQVLHMSVPLDDDSVQEGGADSDSPRQTYLDNVSYISKSRMGLEGSSSGRSSGAVTPSGVVVDHNDGGNFSNWSPETSARATNQFSTAHLDSNDPSAPLSASATNSNVMFGRRGFGDASVAETTTEL